MTTEPTPKLNLAILSPDGFEDLIEALFKAEIEQAKRNIRENVPISYNVISVERTGKGNDEGKDLFVVTLIGDCVDTWQFKWLVQCKHKAQSGKAVSPSNFAGDFSPLETVQEHEADGYLLICSTKPGARIQKQFKRLTQVRDNPYRFVIWGAVRVWEEITKYPEVQRLFFPEYYEWTQKLINKDEVEKWAQKENLSPELLASLREVIDRPETSKNEGN